MLKNSIKLGGMPRPQRSSIEFKLDGWNKKLDDDADDDLFYMIYTYNSKHIYTQ